MTGRVCYLDLDGTLLGPGGSLLRGDGGGFSHAGAHALEMLHGHGVPVVLVSGRTRVQLTEVARVLGAAGFIAEMGAADCGHPVAEGQTVWEAIAATGIPERLLEREPGLVPHATGPWRREGTHLLRGHAGPAAARWVGEESAGALRLADNGVIDAQGTRVWHVMPAGAGKGTAVRRDAAARGVDPAACLAVGNSREDLDMAGVVGRFALVANAGDRDPGLLDAAPLVTHARFGAGVLEAVESWLERSGADAAAAEATSRA